MSPSTGRGSGSGRGDGRVRQPPQQSRTGNHLPDAVVSSSGFSDRVFGFVTGRRDATPTSGGLRGQLMAAFGPSSRDPSRPDLRAASEALGVSVRQLQRWSRGETRAPRGAAAADLSRRARQAVSTRRGRQNAVRASVAAGTARPPRFASSVSLSGRQGVRSSNDEQYRDRTTSIDISSDDLDDLRAAYIERGNAGAADWLHDTWHDNYQSNWHFQSVENLGWE
ncbi:hypothetical protein [uncultured Pseudokineococcus sp.]|uniref:hypothetical protein n=1 Tax=uncultured Pseudokineococcus sp. TaxID=1642928 RepID=UPI0026286766|nr:hypothetical protein [uncultured Pseudokineococcus sp.]